MEIACEALAEYPEGAASALEREEFLATFRLAAKKADVSEKQVGEVEEYLKETAQRQGEKIMAQNLKAEECPSLN
jgi:hypothetical protein